MFEWVMRAEGISFSHALELLRRDLVPLTPQRRPAAENLHGAEAPAADRRPRRTTRSCWKSW